MTAYDRPGGDLDPLDEYDALRLVWPSAPPEVWADLLERIEDQARQDRRDPEVPDHARRTP